MPVFHFILHAFSTWHPDHPDGWHQHGLSMPLRPHKKLADNRRQRQRWPAANFASEHHPQLSEMARDICTRRDWRCHATAINQTHIHTVASWHTKSPEPIEVQHTFKRLLALKLARLTAIPGRRWFSDGGLPRPVEDLDHLHYLLHEYLPNQGGYFWREDRTQ